MESFVRLPGQRALPDDLVQEELSRIEASDGFRHSPQLVRLLRHVVAAAQAGKPEQLREFVLGIEVFRRDPAMFDPKQDPIVRVEARRLRARLDAFYARHGSGSSVRIELPKGGYVPVLRRRPDHVAASTPSIAVLPFANLTGDPHREPFCDGLTDELIDALVKLDGIKVVARTSSCQFKGRAEDVRAIGQRLGVGLVMEGTVQQADSRLKVIAQLIDASDGFHLWSQSFAAEAADMFAVQMAIARDIVGSLQLAGAMSKSRDVQCSVERVASTFARDPRARELCDQARFIVRGLDLARYPHARELLHEALRLDEGFARAHLILGLLETNLNAHAASGTTLSVARARHHVQRAVELDPGLGSAHAMLGWIAMNHDLDWIGAEAHYRRALAAAGGDVVVRNGWANFLCYTGRFAEADDEYARARELDPLHVVPRINRALMLFYARRYEQALAQYEEVQAMDPRQAGVNVIASIHLLRGDAQKALAFAEEIVARFPGLIVGHCRRAEALAAVHRAAEARATLASIGDALGAAGLANWARAHLDAVIGDYDAAFDALADAADARDANFCTAAVTPYFAPMHADSRWKAFVHQRSLPTVDEAAWTNGRASRKRPSN